MQEPAVGPQAQMRCLLGRSESADVCHSLGLARYNTRQCMFFQEVGVLGYCCHDCRKQALFLAELVTLFLNMGLQPTILAHSRCRRFTLACARANTQMSKRPSFHSSGTYHRVVALLLHATMIAVLTFSDGFVRVRPFFIGGPQNGGFVFVPLEPPTIQGVSHSYYAAPMPI